MAKSRVFSLPIEHPDETVGKWIELKKKPEGRFWFTRKRTANGRAVYFVGVLNQAQRRNCESAYFGSKKAVLDFLEGRPCVDVFGHKYDNGKLVEW